MEVAKFGKRNEANTDWEYVYEIPKVYEQDEDFDLIADRSRTAGGLLRQDVIAIKKSWTFKTRPLTYSEAYDFVNFLIGEMFAVGDFWTDEFGLESSTIEAYVSPNIKITRVAFARDGHWYADGRELTVTVEER